ncbi:MULTISPECIES: DUF6366 family protein [Pontibacillus]|uniref:DUF6366 family protein n=1 Tax=Pontibacillus chungwhensis TaxID=265426 RepID=A0ABY8USY1_9BACI|nr:MULTISPECIES: DUF6366 family protein [Pontibacillus]MCD5323406.1 DUF6366 family protein [Pontibacillus sp. HN14]WIF96786.1 DUF6366 family protein [Pontibacillus chungwhensis]
MGDKKETAKERRKRLTNGSNYDMTAERKESYSNEDLFSLGHLVNKLGWKGTGVLTIALIVAYILYTLI